MSRNAGARMRRDARRIFEAGIQAVDPQVALTRHCGVEGEILQIGEKIFNLERFSHIYVIGAGKAAAKMARAAEHLLGPRITGGLVAVKYGHGAALDRIRLLEAGHPVPDDNGLQASRQIKEMAHTAGPNDLVIVLLSGGGSALLPLPAAGISLADKQETIQILLACGATIGEINSIRKHISAIKGGWLARAAHPAAVVTLILSDVVGDRLDVIASGPTVADASSYQDCLRIIRRYGIGGRLPAEVMHRLEKGAAGQADETPKKDDPIFQHCFSRIIANNMAAIMAAKEKAAELGYTPLVLSSMIEGETREAAGMHAAIAREVLNSGHPIPPPACILSGGETTVTIRGEGLGGRNQEFVLAAALKVGAIPGIVILSGGTDGTDGPTDAAGAFADHDTLKRAAAKGLDATDFLRRNDSYHFFEELGDLLKTGPTQTNVMDLRLMLVARPG